MYEMSASLMMHEEGKRQTALKVPGALMAALGRGEGYITALDGKCIRDWVDGAKQLDPTVEKFRNRLLSVCEKGAAYIEEAWGKTPANVQAALGQKFHETLSASAGAYDKAKAEADAAPEATAHTHQPTNATAAIAAAASAGRAARTEDKPREVEPEKEKPPAVAAKPDPAPAGNITPLRGNNVTKALPLAVPPAATRLGISEPMF
jgi:hypothetical protein